MDLSKAVEQLNDVVDSLLRGGSRYQMEKIVTVVVYAIVAVASLVWAFSGGSGENQLGAKFDIERLAEIDDMNLHLINDSDTDWSRVRVVLNRKYLWTLDRLEAGTQKTLRPTDFDYYYHIPRPWGRSDWEQLADGEKPGAKAPETLDIKFVQIRAKEGRSDIAFQNGEPLDEGTGGNVAKVD